MDAKRIWGVIPARLGSTRFPEKPLYPILGKPLLQWVIEAAQTAKELSRVLVATDDLRIAELAQKSGVEAVMTSPDLPSGSDRVWAAMQVAASWGALPDAVLNIQGDEPLITAGPLDAIARALQAGHADMVTLARPFLSLEDLLSTQTAKIVEDDDGRALYFSRHPIPYSRTSAHHSGPPWPACLKHIGIYGYTLSFLKAFCERGVVEAERAEGLEQLRALVMGGQIKVLRTEFESWGVDTPSDVIRVEEKLKSRKEAPECRTSQARG